MTISHTILCLLFLVLPINLSASHPKAIRGVLDLRHWNFQRDGILPLRGEWEFYWHTFVNPNSLAESDSVQNNGFIVLPQPWNKLKISNKQLPWFGHASIRLKIILPDSFSKPIGLKFLKINTCYEVFINGEKIVVSGIPTNEPLNSVPQSVPHVVSYVPKSRTLFLIIHIANYSHIKAGPCQDILLGNQEMIIERREHKIAFELFLIGSILVMGIHYLTMYLLRKQDKVQLFFSLFCFAITLRTLVIGEQYISHIFPFLPWHMVLRIDLWTIHLSATTFSAYIYYLFTHYYDRRILILFSISAGLFASVVLFFPPEIFTIFSSTFQVFLLIKGCYVLNVLFKAMRHSSEGATVILAGFVVLFSAVVNDILFDNGIIHTIKLIPCGLFILLFSQAILLSRRSARIYAKIESLSGELQQINTALKRFVPYEFLHYLERDNIVDVQLGDQVFKQMTILFCDVRSYTEISEKMTPQENFNFLNAFLSKISPAVTHNNGFIDKYVGDGFMALFPKTTDDALLAAIDIQNQVNIFNTSKDVHSFKPIRVGVGAHIGSLMLGTIGNCNRMETTVISDAVNIASHMENLTKWYGAHIIVSNEIITRSMHAQKYSYRSLGTVQIKGKKNPITIIEILDGLPQSEFDIKMETRFMFEQALSHFENGRFNEAIHSFKNILQINEQDSAARFYLNNCKQITRMQSKITQSVFINDSVSEVTIPFFSGVNL